VAVIITVIRPILQLLTLPVTIVTFGLFSLVLNALLFSLLALLVPGFEIVRFLVGTSRGNRCSRLFRIINMLFVGEDHHINK